MGNINNHSVGILDKPFHNAKIAKQYLFLSHRGDESVTMYWFELRHNETLNIIAR